MSPQPSRPRQSSGQRTLDYWKRMNAVIEQEAALRATPAGPLTAAGAGDFIDRRIAAGQFALSEIRGLHRENVDPEVVELAISICDWYEASVAVSEMTNDEARMTKECPNDK